MALPDRFEQVGIVLGSVILVALPASALVSALYGLTFDPWVAMGLWLLPGLVGCSSGSTVSVMDRRAECGR